MPSALLWAYSAENLFYNCNSGKSADFPELLFHRWGRRGKQHLQRRFLRKRGAVEGLPVCFQHAEPSQAHIRSPAPPKGELFAVTAQFPDKMQALRMRQKLPLSGELANPKDLTERASPLKKKASAARIRRFSESSNECADAFYFVCDCVVQ